MVERMTKADLRNRDLQRLRCDDQIRKEEKLHAQSDGVAACARDDRLAKREKCAQQRLNARGKTFVEGPRSLRPTLERAFSYVAKVGAGTEVAPDPANDDDAALIVAGQFLAYFRQAGDHFRRESVLPARAIDRDPRDAILTP